MYMQLIYVNVLHQRYCSTFRLTLLKAQAQFLYDLLTGCEPADNLAGFRSLVGHGMFSQFVETTSDVGDFRRHWSCQTNCSSWRNGGFRQKTVSSKWDHGAKATLQQLVRFPWSWPRSCDWNIDISPISAEPFSRSYPLARLARWTCAEPKTPSFWMFLGLWSLGPKKPF